MTIARLYSLPLLIMIFFNPAAVAIKPVFSENDRQRQQLAIKLIPLMHKLSQPTAVLFYKGKKGHALVLEKEGALKWYNLKTQQQVILKKFAVRSNSELGLLGAALHPRFPKDPRIFIYYNPQNTKETQSRISSFHLSFRKSQPTLKQEKLILVVKQPYSNHNGGHLAFGPDGYLYIGLGDGGSANDPKNAGQNLNTLLGKMLRLDIDTKTKPYAIPKGNPFGKKPRQRQEIWAYGLRNPWRYSFSNNGDLIVADVGQNTFEEIGVVKKGENHGWRIFEGSNCFLDRGQCQKIKHTLPRLTYGRLDGTSITGGYIYEKRQHPLSDHYIFGDFTSGRIWAIPAKKLLSNKVTSDKSLVALGRWPINISSFAKDANGQVYVIDFTGGNVYLLN